MRSGKRESRRTRRRMARNADKTNVKNLAGARLSRGGIRL